MPFLFIFPFVLFVSFVVLNHVFKITTKHTRRTKKIRLRIYDPKHFVLPGNILFVYSFRMKFLAI